MAFARTFQKGRVAWHYLDISKVGLWRYSEVAPTGWHGDGLEALDEPLPGSIIREPRQNHARLAALPIHGGRHAVAVGELEGVEHAEDLGEVAARGGGVEDRCAELLVGAEDQDGARGQGGARARVQFRRVQDPEADRDGSVGVA